MKTPIDSVVIVNADPDFSSQNAYVQSCTDIAVMESVEASIVLTDKDHMILHNNEKLETEKCFFFIRGRKGINSRESDPFFLTAFSEYLFQHNISFSGNINRFHILSSTKIIQMIQLHKNNISIPQTIITRPEGFANNKKKLSEFITYPCVVKVAGANGERVWKIETPHSLNERMQKILNYKKKERRVALIQAYIPNTSDVRVLVFKGHIIGAMTRTSTDGFHNNITQGGVGKVTDLTDMEKEVILHAQKVVGVDFAGIDFIRTPEGPVFLEVNRKPGIGKDDGFEKATGIDVVEHTISLIKEGY